MRTPNQDTLRKVIEILTEIADGEPEWDDPLGLVTSYGQASGGAQVALLILGCVCDASSVEKGGERGELRGSCPVHGVGAALDGETGDSQ